jgi:hypothetical protein
MLQVCEPKDKFAPRKAHYGVQDTVGSGGGDTGRTVSINGPRLRE